MFDLVIGSLLFRLFRSPFLFIARPAADFLFMGAPTRMRYEYIYIQAPLYLLLSGAGITTYTSFKPRYFV